MKKKINTRLVIIALLAIFTTLIGITIVYFNVFKKQVQNDLEISAKLLKDTHYFETDTNNPLCIDLSTDMEELRVTWIAEDGTVLYDNDAEALNLSNHSDRPEIKKAFEKGSGKSIRKSTTMNKSTYYYAVLLDNGSVLRVAIDADNVLSVILSAIPLLAFIIIIISVICIWLSHLLTRQLINPIEKMAQNIEDASIDTPYKELAPFANMIRQQHADILSAVKARQDFTANVSHELKTPLTAISGYAELLEQDMAPKGKEKYFYHEIHKNSDRLLAVINDILRLSELDRGDAISSFEDIALDEIVSDCMEMLHINAKKQNIILEYSFDSCNIHGNKEMIRELVENLVQNSIRYNNPGGHVYVRIIKKERPILIVKDDGIGIPASEQERIFERFYRVDKSRSKETGGTGLGLAIVKHIVELHDAKLEIDSAPGVGTTIKVLF